VKYIANALLSSPRAELLVVWSLWCHCVAAHQNYSIICTNLTRRYSCECQVLSEFLQMSPFEKVHSFNHFAVISILVRRFYAQKFRGSRDTGHAPFRKVFKGSCLDLCLETCTSNLKSAALTILELLAFRGSRDPGHAAFLKKF